MALSPKLELRQSQALVLTPQLQQAIKLLQMSNIELSSYVEGELESNPMLERDDGEGREIVEDAADGPAGGGDGAEAPSEGLDLDGDGGLPELAGPEKADAPDPNSTDSIDADYDNLFNNDSASDQPLGDLGASSIWSGVGPGAGPGGGDGEFGIEQTISQDLTLKDHLVEQLAIAIADPAGRLIGANLIEAIDAAGYLCEPVAAIAERLGTEAMKVEAVLAEIQGFDPTGVGARNLGECLALQLKEADRLDPAMATFLQNLDLLAKHDIDGLSKICGVDREDIQDMILEVRRLNPKPGLIYDDSVAEPVIPDVFVRENSDGGWHVELNAETLPRLLVNTHYHAKIARAAQEKSDRLYLNDCLTNANWLVKSLDQRARTILKVSIEVVRQQDAFLAYGIEHLRPLNLRTVADAISMHESTVSRVTANKYMATPRGIFELKYFFTSAIASAEGGEAHSAEAVRHKIKTLIEQETVKDVLSDDKLVELLRQTGIDIARRTVAKYREAMGIPSSVQRRRLKRLSA